MNSNTLVILLGIIYSIVLHLARSLQRMGIHSFDRFKQQLTGKSSISSPPSRHHIYILGIILSNICVVFVILAGKFGTISYFTAMYGIGMFPMLLFTKFIMKESSGLQNWIGVGMIIGGSYVINLGAKKSIPLDMNDVIPHKILFVLLAILVISPFFIKWGKRTGHLWKDALAAGLTAGLIASLDPVLKATGQHYGDGTGLLPDAPLGWIFFITSFIATTSAMLITQHAYSRKVLASQLIPYYNVSYIAMPVIVQSIVIPGYKPSNYDIMGIIIIIIGVICFSERELRLTKNADIIKRKKLLQK